MSKVSNFLAESIKRYKSYFLIEKVLNGDDFELHEFSVQQSLLIVKVNDYILYIINA